MNQPRFDPANMLGCSDDERPACSRGAGSRRARSSPSRSTTTTGAGTPRDPRSYWVTVDQAARILHLSPSVVERMLTERRLPHVRHASGVRLMRRHEIEERASATA